MMMMFSTSSRMVLHNGSRHRRREMSSDAMMPHRYNYAPFSRAAACLPMPLPPDASPPRLRISLHLTLPHTALLPRHRACAGPRLLCLFLSPPAAHRTRRCLPATTAVHRACACHLVRAALACTAGLPVRRRCVCRLPAGSRLVNIALLGSHSLPAPCLPACCVC